MEDEGQYLAQVQAEAEASMAAQTEYEQEQELATKQAAAPPSPPIDEWSFKMGRAETIAQIYRAIEEGMFLMAKAYDVIEKIALKEAND